MTYESVGRLRIRIWRSPRLDPSTRMERWALRAGVSLRQAYRMRAQRERLCARDMLAQRDADAWWAERINPCRRHLVVMEHLRDRSYADWELAVETSRRLGVTVAAARIRDVLDDIYSSEFLGGEAMRACSVVTQSWGHAVASAYKAKP